MVIEILFIFFIFFSDLIVGKVFNTDHDYVMWRYGTFWFLFHIYFLSCWIIGIINLYKNYKKASDTSVRRNTRLMIFAFSVGIIAPATTSIILPAMGICDYYWMGPISIFFWISLMTYSITRHKLFNIKIITIELAIFALWIILLMRIFSTRDAHSTAEEVGLLIISVLFGTILIRGTLHEIYQNERIEKLTKELQQTYAELKKTRN